MELSTGLIADTGNDPEQQPPANKPPPPFNMYISSSSLLFRKKISEMRNLSSQLLRELSAPFTGKHNKAPE
jgi:hypothetical protein